MQVVHVGGDTAGAGSLVIGTVVRIHVAADAWRDGRIDIDVARQVGRAAGDDYVRTRDRFALRRPVVDADGTVRLPDDHPRG
jgi:flavin reductase (DIM6/NTAB) family NADH-FMN oxidoreductase RutF